MRPSLTLPGLALLFALSPLSPARASCQSCAQLINDGLVTNVMVSVTNNVTQYKVSLEHQVTYSTWVGTAETGACVTNYDHTVFGPHSGTGPTFGAAFFVAV